VASASSHSEPVPWTDTPVAWATRRLQDAGIESPRFEARLLLAQTLGLATSAIITGLYPALDVAQARAFVDLVEARARHVPFAYLRGEQEFYGLPFTVGPAVLIPRPETELLVDFAIESWKARSDEVESGKRTTEDNARYCFADVGTGSGCIAVAILAHCPELRAVAFDLSEAALSVAHQNARRNGVADRLRCVCGSLLDSAAPGYALIVSNPPYIPTGEIAELQPEVRDFEPRLALDGGADGLDRLRGLVAGAQRVLAPEGWLAVEVARGQAEPVAALFRAAGLTQVALRNDLAGIPRMVCGQRWI